MALPDITLNNGVDIINGWLVDSVNPPSGGLLDVMTMAGSGSAGTIIMDYEGRKRKITLHGNLKEGRELFQNRVGVNTLRDQYLAIRTGFDDVAAPSSMTFNSTITGAITVWWSDWIPIWKSPGIDVIEFTINLTEGLV